MDTFYYLNIFNKGAEQLDTANLVRQQLEFRVGIWHNSVVLKIQKPAWLNPLSLKPFEESVFFSIWISDYGINQNKLYYNIHALKMRELKAYNIKSRDFAEGFRKEFKRFEQDWPNVRTDYGPLTLMEGWVLFDENLLVAHLTGLTNQFLTIHHIIDDLLTERKKQVN